MMYTNDNTHNVLYFWVLEVPAGGEQATEMGACSSIPEVVLWEMQFKVTEFAQRGEFEILPFGDETDIHMMLDGMYGHLYLAEM